MSNLETATPPSVWKIRKDSRDSAQGIFTAMRYYYNERIKSKISKGKRHMGQSPEEAKFKLPRILSQWSHTGCASFPRQCCDNACEMSSTREAHLRLSAQGFYQGLFTQATYAQHVPKFQTLQMERGVWHKTHSLYKQIRHSKPFISGHEGNPPTIQVPRCQQGQPGQQVFLRTAAPTCRVNSFLDKNYENNVSFGDQGLDCAWFDDFVMLYNVVLFPLLL